MRIRIRVAPFTFRTIESTIIISLNPDYTVLSVNLKNPTVKICKVQKMYFAIVMWAWYNWIISILTLQCILFRGLRTAWKNILFQIVAFYMFVQIIFEIISISRHTCILKTRLRVWFQLSFVMCQIEREAFDVIYCRKL